MLTDPCEVPQTCAPGRGPAYTWTERRKTPEDVLCVEATGLAGNYGEKEIHLAQAAVGGTLEGGVPLLEMTFNNPNLVGAPGETISFFMEMENTGNGEGHPFEHPWIGGENLPEAWEAPVWNPGHKPVPAGGKSEQTLLVTVPVNKTDDTYKLAPRMHYNQAGLHRFVQSVINVVVEDPEDLGLETDGAIDEERRTGFARGSVS